MIQVCTHLTITPIFYFSLFCSIFSHHFLCLNNLCSSGKDIYWHIQFKWSCVHMYCIIVIMNIIIKHQKHSYKLRVVILNEVYVECSVHALSRHSQFKILHNYSTRPLADSLYRHIQKDHPVRTALMSVINV